MISRVFKTCVCAWACTIALASSLAAAPVIRLGPTDRAPQGENIGIKAPHDKGNGLFDITQTVEARDRLNTMNVQIEEKRKFQLDSTQDHRNYVQENHALALWYVKALVKGLFKSLVNESKDSYREERERGRAQERALAESKQVHERAVSRQPAGLAPPAAPVVNEEGRGVVSTVVSETVRFFDRFTDEGVSLVLPALSANFKLDTKTTKIETKLSSAIMDMSMKYQVPVGETAKPFGRSLVEPGDEQMVVAGSRRFAELGMSAGVSYEVSRQHLNCLVSKQVVGPLSAQVQKQWGFEQGQQDASSASLSMSMTF